jgi:hypothetical protein
MKHKFISEITHEDTAYEVVGAGYIRISGSPNVMCGGRVGFSFGVSWGQHGYCGGVLSREEARNLADRIYELLGECKETEQEYYDSWSGKLFMDMNND